MAFRFFRRLRIAPGLSLNFSKSGLSLSAGPRGAKVTVGPRGVRNTAGLPGTGMYYTKERSWKSLKDGGKSRGSRNRPAAPPQEQAPTPESQLNLSLTQRLFTSSEERALIDGMLAVLHNEDAKALAYFEEAPGQADAGFLGGIVSLRNEDFEGAHRFLERAYAHKADLGSFFKKYGLSIDLQVHLTPELLVPIAANEKGVLLLLTEIYQHFENWNGATTCLRQLQAIDPDDLNIKLSLAEFLVEVYEGREEAYKRVVKLTEDIRNKSEIHAALMLYKARALRGLGLPTAARDTLTAALRRKKGRSQDLIHALSYERAEVYEELGRKSQARKAYEKIYAKAPDFEDVAERLGLA